MENISFLSADALQKVILQQKNQIFETKEKIKKYQLMTKRQYEHLNQLEHKNDSLFQEKKFLQSQRQKLSRELDLLSGQSPKLTFLNQEVSRAVFPK